MEEQVREWIFAGGQSKQGDRDSMEARSLFIEGFLKKENFEDEDE